MASLFLIFSLWCSPDEGSRTAGPDPGDQRYADLVANVASSEALYADIEFVREKDYRLLKAPQGSGDIQVEEEMLRIVLQDGLRYRELNAKLQCHSDGQLEDWERFHEHGFDGSVTRVFEASTVAGNETRIANLHDDWHMDRGWISPHTFLLENAFIGSLRLSEYLMTPKYDEYNLRVRIDGEEEVDGLECIKLRCETWNDGQEIPDHRFLWIAPERNFLPVKTVGYALGYSAEIPLEEGEVLELREIEPGIWFPFEWRKLVWDEIAASEGEWLRSNETTWRITKVDLDPEYDESLFRDIEIPPGTHVYRLRDGQIYDSYLTPSGEPGLRPANSRIRFWLLLINGALLLAAAAWYVYIRRRRTT